MRISWHVRVMFLLDASPRVSYHQCHKQWVGEPTGANDYPKIANEKAVEREKYRKSILEFEFLLFSATLDQYPISYLN